LQQFVPRAAALDAAGYDRAMNEFWYKTVVPLAELPK